MGKIMYYNTGSKEMEHLTRNITMFREMGIECRPFKYFPGEILFKKCDYLYLNWYENIYKGVFPLALCMYIAKRIALRIAKAKGVRIITSQHNRMQHDAKYKKLSRSMFQAVYKDSDTIVVFSMEGKKDLKLFLSEEEIREKTVYVPPVNYIGSYPYIKHDWIDKLYCDKMFTVLFVGNMDRPYKNVDMVIDLARELETEPIRFIFAGKVSSRGQKENYESKIGDAQNIVSVFRFIQDDEMAQLLEVGDAIIAPYDVESISNSGTARLAFSYGKTVICPMIPSLETIPTDLVYCYEYNDAEEHRKKLRESILMACKDYFSDRNGFEEKGSSLMKIMERSNSPKAIKAKYKEILLNR